MVQELVGQVQVLARVAISLSDAIRFFLIAADYEHMVLCW